MGSAVFDDQFLAVFAANVSADFLYPPVFAVVVSGGVSLVRRLQFLLVVPLVPRAVHPVIA